MEILRPSGCTLPGWCREPCGPGPGRPRRIQRTSPKASDGTCGRPSPGLRSAASGCGPSWRQRGTWPRVGRSSPRRPSRRALAVAGRQNGFSQRSSPRGSAPGDHRSCPQSISGATTRRFRRLATHRPARPAARCCHIRGSAPRRRPSWKDSPSLAPAISRFRLSESCLRKSRSVVQRELLRRLGQEARTYCGTSFIHSAQQEAPQARRACGAIWYGTRR